MGEWAQLANTTGVALAVLAAVGFAIWRLGKLVAHKVFGDPDARPPLPGLVDVYLGQQKEFFDGLEEHTKTQQHLCEKHAMALGTIANVLERHDTTATHRTAAIDSLVAMHTDASIPGSTAEAIETVHKLKKAALATCQMGRELANGDKADIASNVCRHCDAIESILKEQAKDT